MLSYRYTLRETFQNLWRNILLAVATVITVGVSLAMFGGFALFQVAVDSATQRWEEDIEFVIWINSEVDPVALDNIEQQLNESPGVASYNFVDKEEAFIEFQELFADSPEVIGTVEQNAMPASFRVVPKDPNVDVIKELGEQFRGQPGVRTVVFASEAIRDIQNLADRAGRVLFLGSVILLAASMLLILNTLAIAISNRRQEIEIMRVVGATKWFIRLPFMLEGLIQGMLGACAAIASNVLLKTYIIEQFSETDALKLLAGFKVGDAALMRTNLMVFVIAGAVSAIGSGFAVTMYLER